MCVCIQNDAINSRKMLGEPSFVQSFADLWHGDNKALRSDCLCLKSPVAILDCFAQSKFRILWHVLTLTIKVDSFEMYCGKRCLLDESRSDQKHPSSVFCLITA